MLWKEMLLLASKEKGDENPSLTVYGSASMDYITVHYTSGKQVTMRVAAVGTIPFSELSSDWVLEGLGDWQSLSLKNARVEGSYCYIINRKKHASVGIDYA